MYTHVDITGDPPNGRPLLPYSAGVFAFLFFFNQRALLQSGDSCLFMSSEEAYLSHSISPSTQHDGEQRGANTQSREHFWQTLGCSLHQSLPSWFPWWTRKCPRCQNFKVTLDPTIWAGEYMNSFAWQPKPNQPGIKIIFLNPLHQYSSHCVSLETQWNPVRGSHELGAWKQEKQWMFYCGPCEQLK